MVQKVTGLCVERKSGAGRCEQRRKKNPMKVLLPRKTDIESDKDEGANDTSKYRSVVFQICH